MPLAGLVDFTGEIAKLGKEQGKVLEQLQKTEAKLGNENFRAKALADVVLKEEEKKNTLTGKLAKIEENIKRLHELAAAD